MDDIRRGVCPLCRHNEIVEAPLYFAGSPPSVGKIRIYACQGCGFCQSFLAHIGELPIGEKWDTRLITGPAPEGPYR
jgi:hypothetical protein